MKIFKKFDLNKLYKIKTRYTKGWITVRAVDAEEFYDQPGLSHGFVHFQDPSSMKCLGFCGTIWFEEHAIPV